MDHENQGVGILVSSSGSDGIDRALLEAQMHATFFQKVILCAIGGFLAASLIEWGKTFVEGADDALNKGYQHHAVIGPSKP